MHLELSMEILMPAWRILETFLLCVLNFVTSEVSLWGTKENITAQESYDCSNSIRNPRYSSWLQSMVRESKDDRFSIGTLRAQVQPERWGITSFKLGWCARFWAQKECDRNNMNTNEERFFGPTPLQGPSWLQRQTGAELQTLRELSESKVVKSGFEASRDGDVSRVLGELHGTQTAQPCRQLINLDPDPVSLWEPWPSLGLWDFDLRSVNNSISPAQWWPTHLVSGNMWSIVKCPSELSFSPCPRLG